MFSLFSKESFLFEKFFSFNINLLFQTPSEWSREKRDSELADFIDSFEVKREISVCLSNLLCLTFFFLFVLLRTHWYIFCLSRILFIFIFIFFSKDIKQPDEWVLPWKTLNIFSYVSMNLIFRSNLSIISIVSLIDTSNCFLSFFAFSFSFSSHPFKISLLYLDCLTTFSNIQESFSAGSLISLKVRLPKIKGFGLYTRRSWNEKKMNENWKKIEKTLSYLKVVNHICQF